MLEVGLCVFAYVIVLTIETAPPFLEKFGMKKTLARLDKILFLVIVVKCVKGGKKAAANPWDGAEGLEWTVPSPAPYHTFSTPPEVK